MENETHQTRTSRIAGEKETTVSDQNVIQTASLDAEEVGALILKILDSTDSDPARWQKEAARRGISVNQLRAAAITSAIWEMSQQGSGS